MDNNFKQIKEWSFVLEFITDDKTYFFSLENLYPEPTGFYIFPDRPFKMKFQPILKGKIQLITNMNLTNKENYILSFNDVIKVIVKRPEINGK